MKRFFYCLYDFLIFLLLPAISIFFLVRLIARPEYRSGIAQRLGRYPDHYFMPLSGKKVFWVHAVSVGEVVSSGAFIDGLRKKYPDASIVFSTVTPTGQAAARQRLQGVDLFFYFPLDHIRITRALVHKMSPALFIFFETEIWPNTLRALSEQGVPSILLNGRISDRGFRRYRLIRFFLSYVFENVSFFLMQTERDVEKIVSLGAPEGRVEKTGNMKYDQAVSLKEKRETAALRAELGLSGRKRLIVAGSTHDGEEKAVLEAYDLLSSECPDFTLLIAPRHLDRLSGIEQFLLENGRRSIRKGRLSGLSEADRPEADVILLDTLGELDQFYSIADLIFVGGSLVPVGGHNVLEAAVCRKPVFFGPHMFNFQEIAVQLKGAGGGIEVADGKEMGRQMAWLIRHPDEYRKRGESAYLVVLNNRGAVKRNLERVANWISA